MRLIKISAGVILFACGVIGALAVFIPDTLNCNKPKKEKALLECSYFNLAKFEAGQPVGVVIYLANLGRSLANVGVMKAVYKLSYDTLKEPTSELYSITGKSFNKHIAPLTQIGIGQQFGQLLDSANMAAFYNDRIFLYLEGIVYYTSQGDSETQSYTFLCRLLPPTGYKFVPIYSKQTP
ncbi:MAG: hypothetical protein E6H09_03080 [Bacteroidetes bacterium]|nr:MAG: hypothetical protein E6H09_03080 [Bacteroidota bacterium]